MSVSAFLWEHEPGQVVEGVKAEPEKAESKKSFG